MALPALLGASGAYYEVPTVTFPTTTGTIAVIARMDDDTARQNFLHTVFPPDVGLDWRGDTAGDPVQFFRQGSPPPYASAGANVADFASYALGAWCSLIASWDTTNTWLYLGRVGGPPPVEPSAYTIRTTIATPNTTAANLRVMNSTAATTRHPRGPMAALAVAPTVWTPEQRQAFNHARFIHGCDIFHFIGASASPTSPVLDLSGNGRHGTWTNTPTAATGPGVPAPEPNLPLKPRPFAPAGISR